MAEYQPIKTNASMATSTAESNESRVFSDDDLIEVEDFASFKCYTPKEMECLFVTFNQIEQIYSLDNDVEAHFFAPNSLYPMKPDDIVGICPMRKSVPFITKRVSECQVEANPQAITTEDIIDEADFVAKKAIFKIPTLPAEMANEFYFQFCYMNAKSDLIGVSTPFRFHNSSSDSLHGSIASSVQLSQTSPQLGENYESMVMEKRDDDDFIVVRSQESFLKERVEHLTKSNTLLEYLIRSLEKDLSNKTVELQKIANKLDDEKGNAAKIEGDKNRALADFEDISRKHLDLQQAMVELKSFIEKEREANKHLQAELTISKEKIYKLEDTFQTIQVEEVDLKKILKDKEEEISYHKDMVANLQQIHDELNKKVLAAEDKVLNLQSSLAVALNDRRALMQEKEKYNNYDNLTGENQSMKQRIADLESIKEKQTNEIKTLEDELRNSVSNFNNLDAKFQAERSTNATKEQQNALTLDKTKFELIEMHARLEQSRVEYANLYRKYRTLQKMDRSKSASSQASRSDSIVSIASTSGTRPNAAPRAKDKMDDIDLKLHQLEKEEELPKQIETLVKSAANLSLGSQSPKESLLIDIENEHNSNDAASTTSEVAEVPVEANTSAKTLASPAIQQPKEKTVVAIPCIMCDKVIQCQQHEDGSGQMHEMVNHLETIHRQKMCPVCSTLFDTRLPIFSTYFANHIQNHFNNIKYPSLNNSN